MIGMLFHYTDERMGGGVDLKKQEDLCVMCGCEPIVLKR